MKIQILSALCFGLLGIISTAQANDKVSQIYDAQRYHKACQNQSQGAHVTFAHRGIIWNGTCQPQFMPTDKNVRLHGNETQIYSACSSTTGTTTIQIDGKTVAGKCVLGFTPPQPR